MNLKGITFILVSSFLYGTYGIWSRMMGDSFAPFYQAWTRGLLILVILGIIIYTKRLHRKIEREDIKWFLLLGILASFTLAPVYYAFNNMDISLVTLIFYGSIILSNYVLGPILFREKLNLIKLFALVQSLMGLVLLYSFAISGTFSLLAFIAACVSGVSTAFEYLFTKKLSGKYDTFYIMFISYIFITASNFAASFILQETFTPIALNQGWIVQIIFTIVALGAYYFAIQGYKYLPAMIAGLLSITEAIFGLLLGTGLYGDVFDNFRIVGSFLILTSMLLPKLSEIDIEKEIKEKSEQKLINKNVA